MKLLLELELPNGQVAYTECDLTLEAVDESVPFEHFGFKGKTNDIGIKFHLNGFIAVDDKGEDFKSKDDTRAIQNAVVDYITDNYQTLIDKYYG